jgi:hypothetical protein
LIYKIYPSASLLIGWLYSSFIIATLASLIRNYRNKPELFSLLIAMILYSIAFSFLTAVGRSCSGNEAAFGGRYYLYVAPAFIASIIYLTYNKFRIFNATNLYIFTMIFIFLNLLWENKNHTDIISYNKVKKNWIQCMEKYKNVTECTKMHAIYPIPNGIDEISLIFLNRNNH